MVALTPYRGDDLGGDNDPSHNQLTVDWRLNSTPYSEAQWLVAQQQSEAPASATYYSLGSIRRLAHRVCLYRMRCARHTPATLTDAGVLLDALVEHALLLEVAMQVVSLASRVREAAERVWIGRRRAAHGTHDTRDAHDAHDAYFDRPPRTRAGLSPGAGTVRHGREGTTVRYGREGTTANFSPRLMVGKKRENHEHSEATVFYKRPSLSGLSLSSCWFDRVNGCGGDGSSRAIRSCQSNFCKVVFKIQTSCESRTVKDLGLVSKQRGRERKLPTPFSGGTVR